jgi:putative ABC transport system ATP-binding protein
MSNNNAKGKNGKNDNVIVCKNICKVYNKGTPAEVNALCGVNLKIRRGELVSIIGASGSGKSTLLNCIGSLDRPSSGKCIVNGRDTSKLNEDELAVLRRDSIGFIFQFFNLIPTLTAVQNVELPMIFKGLPQSERKERARELLRKIGLEKRMNSRSSQLSGGETQRVAITRALANDPAFILADEPTGNLDTKSGQAVMEIFKKLNEEGRTVIIVTHDPNIAKQTNRIIRLTDGKVVEEMM